MGGVPPYGYDLRYESFSGEFLMHVRYMRDGKLVSDAVYTVSTADCSPRYEATSFPYPRVAPLASTAGLLVSVS